MAITYFASRISENISIMEGSSFLICRNACIARTGWQTYDVRDLPQTTAAKLGVDLSNPYAQINVYRPAEEVFAPSTISSFEGQAVTDSHPPEFIDPENFRKYTCGHVANVRKGPESLDSGDWPLLADLIISDAALIRKIENGLRQISCGYDFEIAREGDKILQIGIVGNHVAVLRKGRAGAEARINDSLPDDLETQLIEAGAWVDKTTAEAANTTNSKKEKYTVKEPKMWRRVLLGLGIKALAADAETKPEELAEAAEAMANDNREEKEHEMTAEDRKRAADKAAADCAANDKRAKDEMEEKIRKEMADKAASDKAASDKATADAKAKDGDCMPGKEGHMKCTADKCMANDRGARDADGGGHRSRMHAALDTMLDKHEKENGPLEGEDADVNELKELMGKLQGQETGEAANGEEAEEKDSDESEILEPVGEYEEEAAAMANDAAEAVLIAIDALPETSREHKVVKRDLKSAFDAAPLDTPFEFLKAMKPTMADTKANSVRKAYDAEVRKFRTSRATDGGYGEFGAAAHATDAERIAAGKRAAENNAGRSARDNSKINAIYADYRNGKTPVNTR